MEIIKDIVSEKEYREYLLKNDFSDYVKSSDAEVEKIEDLLDLRRGVLKSEEYSVKKSICKCGKTLTFLDFVTTALSEGMHSKTFLTSALLGNKYGFQTPRDVKCSSCGEVTTKSVYRTPSYSCRER